MGLRELLTPTSVKATALAAALATAPYATMAEEPTDEQQRRYVEQMANITPVVTALKAAQVAGKFQNALQGRPPSAEKCEDYRNRGLRLAEKYCASVPQEDSHQEQ